MGQTYLMVFQVCSFCIVAGCEVYTYFDLPFQLGISSNIVRYAQYTDCLVDASHPLQILFDGALLLVLWCPLLAP